MTEMSDFLHNQARQYESRCLLKLAMFPEYLLSTGQRREVVAEHSQLLDHLSNLSGATILQHATPFLWRQLRNCYFHAAHGDMDLSRSCQEFCVMVFDSFYNHLPIGTTITVQLREPTSMVLPSLGILVPRTAGRVRLERTCLDTITISIDDTHHSITVDNVDAEFTFPTLNEDARKFVESSDSQPRS